MHEAILFSETRIGRARATSGRSITLHGTRWAHASEKKPSYLPLISCEKLAALYTPDSAESAGFLSWAWPPSRP